MGFLGFEITLNRQSGQIGFWPRDEMGVIWEWTQLHFVYFEPCVCKLHSEWPSLYFEDVLRAQQKMIRAMQNACRPVLSYIVTQITNMATNNIYARYINVQSSFSPLQCSALGFSCCLTLTKQWNIWCLPLFTCLELLNMDNAVIVRPFPHSLLDAHCSLFNVCHKISIDSRW